MGGLFGRVNLGSVVEDTVDIEKRFVQVADQKGRRIFSQRKMVMPAALDRVQGSAHPYGNLHGGRPEKSK